MHIKILFENGRCKQFISACKKLSDFFHTYILKESLIPNSKYKYQQAGFPCKFSLHNYRTQMILGLYIEFNVNLFLYLFFTVFCLQFNCCAVNPVTGVNNDFDETAWCTTEGECHDINAQIPKTCCVGVNASNFEDKAQPSCFVYLTSGFKTTVEFYLCVITICQYVLHVIFKIYIFIC